MTRSKIKKGFSTGTAAIESFICDYIHRLLEHTRGNITLASRISGFKRQSLQKIVGRHGIRVKRYRDTAIGTRD